MYQTKEARLLRSCTVPRETIMRLSAIHNNGLGMYLAVKAHARAAGFAYPNRENLRLVTYWDRHGLVHEVWTK